MKTKYYYENFDSKAYQVFKDYLTYIETDPAMNPDYPPEDENKVEKDSGGNIIANDEVLYTDIYYYLAIDDLNPDKAQKQVGNEFEDVDIHHRIYIQPDLFLKSAKSTLYVSTNDNYFDLESPRNGTRDLSSIWLKSYNINEQYFTDSTKWTEDTGEWSIGVPFDHDDIDSYKNKVFTKVYGVIVAEDGKHKNIVRVNVIVDQYKPAATLEAVTVSAPIN